MHAGRDDDDVLGLATRLPRDSHEETARNIAAKLPLAEYLRVGLKAADEQAVDLDAEWRLDEDEDGEGDEYPDVPESERADCDWCGRSVPDTELAAVGAGGQESPMICARCWAEMDDEARRENGVQDPRT